MIVHQSVPVTVEPFLTKFKIVRGILKIVDAKITGITDAELSLIGIDESCLPDNFAYPGRFAY